MEVKTITNPSEEQLCAQPRVWRNKHLYFGTLLGGYICGFYLLGENYKALGYPQLARKAIIAGLVSTFVTLGVIYFLPLDSNPYDSFLVMTTQGLLVIAYLLFEHSKVLEDQVFTWKTSLTFAICVAVVLTSPLYLPKQFMASIPSIMGPIVQIALIDSFARLVQEQHIKKLMENGSKKNSIRRLLKITFFSLLALLAYFAVFFCVDALIAAGK